MDRKWNLRRDVQCLSQHDKWIYARLGKFHCDRSIWNELFEYGIDFGNAVLLRCRGSRVDGDKCSIEPGKCDDHGCNPECTDWTNGDGGFERTDQSKLDRQYYIGCDL